MSLSQENMSEWSHSPPDSINLHFFMFFHAKPMKNIAFSWFSLSELVQRSRHAYFRSTFVRPWQRGAHSASGRTRSARGARRAQGRPVTRWVDSLVEKRAKKTSAMKSKTVKKHPNKQKGSGSSSTKPPRENIARLLDFDEDNNNEFQPDMVYVIARSKE